MTITRGAVTAALVCVGWAGAGWCQAPQAAAAPPENKIIMQVNGDPVYASDVNLAAQGVAGRMGQQGNQEQVVQAATDQVIGLKLLAQEARRRGVTVGNEHVTELLGRMERQAGDRVSLEAGIRRMGMTYADLERAIQESELVRQFIDAEVRSKVEVSAEDVETFYNGNQEMFRTPERVQARHILFKVGEGATDEERAAAQQKANDARGRAVSGEDFAALAKELSEGPSAKKGGDLGFFTADRMVEPFSKAAFALQPGGLSEVVETRFGYHVIKVEERQSAGIRSFDEVSESLHDMLVENETSERTAALVERLKGEASIGPPGGDQPKAGPPIGPAGE